ncbi:MAG: 2,3-bisphosphoglycerate-independent phosphoglycerate mutase, partial [Candidatus Omnitrophota bacterium]
APLEAASLNIDLREDEIAFRCNLVTVENNKMIDYSAGHIPTQEASTLIGALNNELASANEKFYAGKSYRHLLVIKSRQIKKLAQLKFVPPHDILGQKINAYLPSDRDAIPALKLMEQSKRILGNHPINKVRIDLRENPANMIWLWGQGVKPQLPLFKDQYGVEGSIISAVDLVNGIGKLAGLEVIKVPGATGYYDTNFSGKAQYALESLKKKDFVFIHIEAPDEAGHNGDLKAKLASIENIDREIVGAILNHYDIQDDVRILILPDHPTPLNLRTHTADPVCFVMAGKGIPANDSESFGESAAQEKGIKFRSGEELMKYFISANL